MSETVFYHVKGNSYSRLYHMYARHEKVQRIPVLGILNIFYAACKKGFWVSEIQMCIINRLKLRLFPMK